MTTYFHEEQQFQQWWIWVLLVLVDAPLITTMLTTGEFRVDLLVASTLVAFVLVLLLTARLAVDVDRDEIRVAFHFLWPTRRIPVADIRRAYATTYNALVDYGGWGVRFSPWAGWAFNTGGAEGVLIETTSGSRIMVGSRRAKELEAAIGRAIADR